MRVAGAQNWSDRGLHFVNHWAFPGSSSGRREVSPRRHPKTGRAETQFALAVEGRPLDLMRGAKAECSSVWSGRRLLDL